jgi:hypothetical protein
MDAHLVYQEFQAGLAHLKNQLEQELDHLHDGLASLDPFSRDENEKWAHELYQRIIRRRRATLAALFSTH